jgi:hypothetical protein
MFKIAIIRSLNSDFQFSMMWQKNLDGKYKDEYYGFRVNYFCPERMSHVKFFSKVIGPVWKWGYNEQTPERVIKRLEKLSKVQKYEPVH